MSIDQEIAEIEARADAVGKRMHILCTEAGLAPSTYFRWKNGAEPKRGKLAALRDRLGVLEREQAKKAAAA